MKGVGQQQKKERKREGGRGGGRTQASIVWDKRMMDVFKGEQGPKKEYCKGLRWMSLSDSKIPEILCTSDKALLHNLALSIKDTISFSSFKTAKHYGRNKHSNMYSYIQDLPAS